MNPIIFPLESQMQGPTVADLQAALELLELTIADAEKTAQRYGQSTRQALRQFQTAHDLPITGQVNQATANVLNNILAELGVLDDVPGTDPTPTTPNPAPVKAYTAKRIASQNSYIKSQTQTQTSASV
jgi:peptidoglycan hydrolase-like protein with peptidoglycan-binding domain